MKRDTTIWIVAATFHNALVELKFLEHFFFSGLIKLWTVTGWVLITWQSDSTMLILLEWDTGSTLWYIPTRVRFHTPDSAAIHPLETQGLGIISVCRHSGIRISATSAYRHAHRVQLNMPTCTRVEPRVYCVFFSLDPKAQILSTIFLFIVSTIRALSFFQKFPASVFSTNYTF